VGGAEVTWLDDLKLDTVVIHLLTGRSVKGLVAAVHDDCVVLKKAYVLESEVSEGQISLLDGNQVFLRERIEWVQDLSNEAVE
jgi:hypothetical protein